MTRWQRFRCWIGWHNPTGIWQMNLASFNLTERRCLCGRLLLMDSQGNWFAVGRTPDA